MTYITYETAQVSDYEAHQLPRVQHLHYHNQPPKKIPSNLTKPEFMPSWLVRVSDMKVIKGCKVNEAYCTLSYSWNQSGEIIVPDKETEKSRRIDEGKHKIIFSAKTIRPRSRGRKRLLPSKVKFVKFEGIIRQICKDFNIKYIWFDQMCINQENDKEKLDEIRQMHKIYSNAYCTVVLIPELKPRLDNTKNPQAKHYRIDDFQILKSQWMKRTWTLEEAVMSSRMLFIGPNAHMWWYRISDAVCPLFHEQLKRNVNTVLHYAHTRNSTKDHDKIFALANIFPNILKDISINYKQKVEKLMIEFYGALAKRDITILCFKSHFRYKMICRRSNNTGREAYDIPIQKYNLPSWTGIYGEHDEESPVKTSFRNYTINGRIMQVTCGAITNDQYITDYPTLVLESNDIPSIPQNRKNVEWWYLTVLVTLPNDRSEKKTCVSKLYDANQENNSLFRQDITKALRDLSHFLRIDKTSLCWEPIDSNYCGVTDFNFNQLAEELQASAQYVMLTGISLEFRVASSLSPYYIVIKKDGDYYKATGMCHISFAELIFAEYKPNEQTFEIQ